MRCAACRFSVDSNSYTGWLSTRPDLSENTSVRERFDHLVADNHERARCRWLASFRSDRPHDPRSRARASPSPSRRRVRVTHGLRRKRSVLPSVAAAERAASVSVLPMPHCSMCAGRSIAASNTAAPTCEVAQREAGRVVARPSEPAPSTSPSRLLPAFPQLGHVPLHRLLGWSRTRLYGNSPGCRTPDQLQWSAARPPWLRQRRLPRPPGAGLTLVNASCDRAALPAPHPVPWEYRWSGWSNRRRQPG